MQRSKARIKGRGISNIVAVIMLIIIAISSSLLIYTWMSDFVGKMPKRISPSTLTQAEVLVANVSMKGDHSYIYAYVENLGSLPIEVEGVYVINLLNSLKIVGGSLAGNITIQPKEVGLIKYGSLLINPPPPGTPIVVEVVLKSGFQASYSLTWPYYSSSTGKNITLEIYNTQDDPTPKPFQQMINVSISWIDASLAQDTIKENWTNIFFYNISNGKLLYSWLENYTSSYAIFWVKLKNGLQAKEKVKIGMFVAKSSVVSAYYPYTGISPTIYYLGHYGKYDNGGYVFNYYQSWVNLTSLPPGWRKVPGTRYEFTPRYTKISSRWFSEAWYGIYIRSLGSSSPSSFMSSFPAIIEFYGNISNYLGTTAAGLSKSSKFHKDKAAYVIYDDYGNIHICNDGHIKNTYILDFNSNKVYSLVIINKSSVEVMLNYKQAFVEKGLRYVKPNYFIFGVSSGQIFIFLYPSNIYLYWIRERAYPPNGLMPKVSLVT
ncbi:MAG: hypothetical protein G5Z43_001044 [Caldisphaeraceae archaeon]|nr:hypothetical protein [Caldisphaeraceae archaeon]